RRGARQGRALPPRRADLCRGGRVRPGGLVRSADAAVPGRAGRGCGGRTTVAAVRAARSLGPAAAGGSTALRRVAVRARRLPRSDVADRAGGERTARLAPGGRGGRGTRVR